MKYPRTFHLPCSMGGTSDDKRLTDVLMFDGIQLVYTEKLDGENTVMTNQTIHARSEDGYSNEWQTYMKREWNTFRFNIPDGMTICGENLYAVHSIEYERLTSYFYVFNIMEGDIVLSWNDTVYWAELIGLPVVPVIRFGAIDEMPIPSCSAFGSTCEGYVVRNIEAFPVTEFKTNVAKCVRENHVQTDVHWRKNWTKAEIHG
jgi:hypothetical protein